MATEPQVGIGGIHDIYTSSDLKSFLGNRIGYENSFPFPAPFAPTRLPFRRLLVPSCRSDGTKKDRVHDRAIDRVPDHASDRSAHLVPSPVPFISPCSSRPSHPIIYLVVRSLVPCRRSVILPCQFRPAFLPVVSTSRAGRDCRCPYLRIMPVVSARSMSWGVVGYRWMLRDVGGVASSDVVEWDVRQAGGIDIAAVSIQSEDDRRSKRKIDIEKSPSPNRWRASYLRDSVAPFPQAQSV